MSDKKRVTYKPFTVKHLLQKDDKKDQDRRVVNFINGSTLHGRSEEGKIPSPAPIFTASPKHDSNSKALNLAERLAGDLRCHYNQLFLVYNNVKINLF